jgi:hypothetical protein
MVFFIGDLHRHIKQLHKKQFAGQISNYTLKKSVFWETQLGFPNLLLSETFLGFPKKIFRGLGNPKVDDIISDKNLAPETDYPFPIRQNV